MRPLDSITRTFVHSDFCPDTFDIPKTLFQHFPSSSKTLPLHFIDIYMSLPSHFLNISLTLPHQLHDTSLATHTQKFPNTSLKQSRCTDNQGISLYPGILHLSFAGKFPVYREMLNFLLHIYYGNTCAI